MGRPRIMILGKLPPPFIGPAVATEILLHSRLNADFELFHFDTKINEKVEDMGSFRWSKLRAIRDIYSRYAEALKLRDPDLVLVPIGQTTAGFFKDIPFITKAAAEGSKVLIQLRGSAFRDWFDALDPLRKKIVRNTLSRAHGAIVLGENLRYIFKGIFPEEAIFVVPNGGDFQFPPRKSKNLIITWLANYLPGKGLKETLQALHILDAQHDLPDFEFRAYGSWDDKKYRDECLALADDLSIPCTLAESISGPEKWQALADGDIFVFTPRAPEGHPWSIVEATAAGLPLVTTDRGAICQSVKHGVNGVLLDHPDPHEIAAGLTAIITDASLRNKMGAASRTLYEKEFTGETMARKMGEVFHQVLETSCVGS